MPSFRSIIWTLVLCSFLQGTQGLNLRGSTPQSKSVNQISRRSPEDIVTRYETLVVSEADLTVGCTQKRSSIVINGTSPGPVLRFNSYERIIINVTNQLIDQNVTMHWHGLAMAASPWSDGTPMISQWPIAAGDYFLYEFFPTSENTGTYFYHSHVGLQLSTAHGALIISPNKQCKTLQPEVEDKIMLLADYWYKEDRVLLEGLLSDPFVWTNSSNAIYLNGLSNGTLDAQQCSTNFPVIQVEPNTSYRLRWIHAGSLMYISAGIQGHKLVLIEADGSDMQPFTSDHVELGAGQRYSTLLHTKTVAQLHADGQNGDYLIKLSSRWRNPGISNYAILRYRFPTDLVSRQAQYVSLIDSVLFEKAVQGYVLPNETYGWKASSFAPRIASLPPANVNSTLLTLHTQQKQWGVKGSKWQTNGKSYNELNQTRNKPPFLIQFYQNLTDTINSYDVEKSPSDNIYEPLSDTYVLEAGQVIDIVIINDPSPTGKTEIHPWHLHGRKFWVLAAGQGNFNSSSYISGLFKRPYQRDTINVYPGPGQSSFPLSILSFCLKSV